MTPNEHRIAYLEWMVGLGLAPETADAILASMAPFGGVAAVGIGLS